MSHRATMFSPATPLRLSPPRLATPMTPMFSFSLGESLRAAEALGTASQKPAAPNAVRFRKVRRDDGAFMLISLSRQFANVNILKEQFIAVVLQLDLAGGINRFVPFP